MGKEGWVETSSPTYKLSPIPSVFSMVLTLHLSWCLPVCLILPRGKLHELAVVPGHNWGWKLLGVYLPLTQPSDWPFIPLSRTTWCHHVLSLGGFCQLTGPGLRTLLFQLCQINYHSPICFPTSKIMLLFPFFPFFAFVDLCTKIALYCCSGVLERSKGECMCSVCHS